MRSEDALSLGRMCGSGVRHPWQEEPDWEAILPDLQLEAMELLVELECGAEALWRRALRTLEGELGLDPSLCAEHQRCHELGPWAWLRSTPLYRSLERELSGRTLAEDESWAGVLGTR